MDICILCTFFDPSENSKAFRVGLEKMRLTIVREIKTGKNCVKFIVCKQAEGPGN